MGSGVEPNNHSLLKVEPENIYFGLLRVGEGGNVTLKVTGGPGDIVVHNDRLIITPTTFENEETEVQLELLAGSAGDLIWDNIIFKRETDKINVLVTARWEGFPPQDTVVNRTIDTTPNVEIGEHPTLVKTQELPTAPRPWGGRRCTRCHKNFAYDANTHDWEQCRCNWFQIIVNMCLRIISELRYGIKDFPSFAKETWNIILGKEKW